MSTHECVINTKFKCPNTKISGKLCTYCKIPDITGRQCQINLKLTCPDHKHPDDKSCSDCKFGNLQYQLDMIARENSKRYKIKFHGVKIEVEELLPTDTIDERCLYQNVQPYDALYGYWFISEAIDDKVSEHPNRKYVKIISPWYK